MRQKNILITFIPVILCFLIHPLILADQEVSYWKNFPMKKILDNGMTLIYQRDVSSATTVLNILIKGGKRAVVPSQRGLAYLTTRLAIEIPDQGKVQALMTQASHVSMSSKGDYSFITIACLSEILEDTLEIMTKIITDPLFSGLRINSIKDRMKHQMKTEEDNPLNVAHNAHLETLLAEKGYAGSALGSEESLERINKDDIVHFYKNNFRGGNMIVAVSSDLGEEALIGICTQFLEKFPPGISSPSEKESLTNENKKKITIQRETKQSVVSLAFPLPELTARNFALAFMMDIFLGKGVGSKLWPLRSKEKLAYNVNSRANGMIAAGMLEAYLETDHEKQEMALEELKEVLLELYEEGIIEEGLKITKIQSKAAFLRNNETKNIKTLNLAAFEALGLGYEYLNDFFLEINAVTLEEMNAYIKDVLDPEKATEVIVGPAKQ